MNSLLKFRPVRILITWIRLFVLVRLAKRLRTHSSEHAFGVTLSHNLKGLHICDDRIKTLILPLVSIERVKPDWKILIIGPRNEHDLLFLNGYGIPWKSMTGLDLISYSSRIKLGDMHAMPFEDNRFDAVIFGWTLSYSATPKKAVDEVIRVLKPGGIAAVGVEYTNLKEDESKSVLGYSIQEYDRLSQRVNSTAAIHALFGKHAGHIYFDHDAPLKRSHSPEGLVKGVSSVATILEIQK